MTNNTKTKSILVIVASVGLLVLSFVVFWYWYNSVNSGLREVVALSQNSSNITQLAKLQGLRRESRDTVEARNRLRSLTIIEAEIPTFLNKLESLGNLRVTTRSIDKSADTGLLTVSLSFSGGFNEVMYTMQQLSTARPAAYVDSFDMRTSKDGGWDASMYLALLVAEPNK